VREGRNGGKKGVQRKGKKSSGSAAFVCSPPWEREAPRYSFPPPSSKGKREKKKAEKPKKKREVPQFFSLRIIGLRGGGLHRSAAVKKLGGTEESGNLGGKGWGGEREGCETRRHPAPITLWGGS